MKKKKNKTKVLFGAIAIVLVVAIVVSSLMIKNYFDTYGLGDEVKTKYTTDLYELPENPNEYQIEIYEELAEKCQGYEEFPEGAGLEDIAALIVKSFVADYFTWSNKRGSYDVGGLDYVYGPQYLNIQAQARYYYYYDLDLLINEYGSDNLPAVTNITITSSNHCKDLFYFDATVYDEESGEYADEQTGFDAYHVVVTWEYDLSNDSSYDDSNLPTGGNFMVINNAGRLEIAYYHQNYY